MIHPTCQIAGLEEIFKQHFGDRKGTFVEVGAHDGISYSNTWGLANDGWKGLYIEPIKHYADKCKAEHVNNNVTVIEAACSDHNGYITLYQGSDIYSANQSMVQGEPITVLCYKLDAILLATEIKQIDLLVIDVEFHEREVLQGFTIDSYRPKMVIIEAHEHHENEAYRLNADFINDYFKWYKKIYSDGINNIYVRN